MSNTLSFLAEEKLFDPLPSPCPACGHGVGVVSVRDKAVGGLRCQKCNFELDRVLVRVHPLRKDCPCGATAAAGFGFVIPKANNNALHCLTCGTWNWNVSNADLGAAPAAPQRPKISEGLRLQVFEDAGHICQIHRGDEERLEVGHCLSVADARVLGVPDDVTYDWWNLCAMCWRCNQALGGRSVRPSLYIGRLKPGEIDKVARHPTFTKVLVALGKALALRQEAA